MPSTARFRSGDERPDEVRHAADIPAFVAFAPDADISPFLRKGAVEALGARLDFPRESMALRKQWIGK